MASRKVIRYACGTCDKEFDAQEEETGMKQRGTTAPRKSWKLSTARSMGKAPATPRRL
jgi:hypothetical protein